MYEKYQQNSNSKSGSILNALSTLKVILAASVDALALSWYVVWKIFKIINLKIGMDLNQLGHMRYNKDKILGSVAIFANGQYLLLFLLTQSVQQMVLQYII